jgi:anhydro-N-acetylmuramic acid kinase
LRRSKESNRVILNIGGIANLTYLPRACQPDDVVAFDTGPGNMIIDALFQVLYPGEGRYDADGERGLQGEPAKELVDEFMENPYFGKSPPKSAGHREFGAPYAWQFQTRAEELGLGRADTLASAVSLTTRTVTDAIDNFVRDRGTVDTVYVSGGGVHNRAVFEGVDELLGETSCLPIDELGIPADAKEAVDFAVLARETLMGRPNVLPSVTGATRALVLGTIAWGERR